MARLMQNSFNGGLPSASAWRLGPAVGADGLKLLLASLGGLCTQQKATHN